MREKLIFTIVARTGDGKTKSTTIRFTPGVIGGEEKEITCGSIKMCVKVTWSIVSRWYYPHIADYYDGACYVGTSTRIE